jgi:hypothetical protein
MAKDTDRGSAEGSKNAEKAPPAAAGPAIKFDTSSVKSSYANFCNATSTREEVVVNFGINSDWDRRERQLEVQIQHRIILSPFAAKRLSQLLSELVRKHEASYGELK